MPLVDKLALRLDPDRFAAEGYERRDGVTLLSSGTSGRRRRFDPALRLENLLAGVNEFKPEVFRGIGSHLRIEKPKAVTCGADAMPKADRRIIEEHPSMPVVST